MRSLSFLAAGASRRNASRCDPRSGPRGDTPSKPVDLLQAGRRSDVDLGEIVADHVDGRRRSCRAAPAPEADDVADLAVAFGELGPSPLLPPTCMLERASPSAGTRFR